VGVKFFLFLPKSKHAETGRERKGTLSEVLVLEKQRRKLFTLFHSKKIMSSFKLFFFVGNSLSC